MTATRAFVFDLAGSGDFDSFGQTLMSFLFWHLAGPVKSKNANAVIYFIRFHLSRPQVLNSRKK